jgi:phosphatidylinositol alpha-1,6-mannosyltransferase
MKISIITPGAKGGYGGISKYNSNIVNFFLKKNDCEKIYLFSRTRVNYKHKKIISSSASSKLYFLFILFFNQLNLFRSDIIFITHINLILFCLFPILLKKKVVLINYGLEIWGTKKNFIYQWLIKKINFFICMREYTKKVLIKKYKIGKNKNFFDLHNAIKFRKIKLNKKLSKDLVTVARLDASEKFKGIDETLEALGRMKEINFIYHIIGDGNDKQRLINKAKRVGCFKHVKFYGKIDDKKRDMILTNSKIMIMPGSDLTFDTYPFRFIFLEAAEFGLHLIGSFPPDLTEKQYEKKYSCLNYVNPKNKQSIINKIRMLQKKNKLKDKKFMNDFSIINFNKKLKKISLKIQTI